MRSGRVALYTDLKSNYYNKLGRLFKTPLIGVLRAGTEVSVSANVRRQV